MEKDLSQKNIFFQKNTLCHSFRISVIPSILLSFLPYYCHSFHITVIPSILLSFLPNIVIPSELFRELQILTSSKCFPYPKGEKNGHQRWPYMRVYLIIVYSYLFWISNLLGKTILDVRIKMLIVGLQQFLLAVFRFNQNSLEYVHSGKFRILGKQ